MHHDLSSETVLTWKSQNVGEWLIDIGLQQYVNKFKRYEVTGAVLLQLDETLLDDLAITKDADREVLLNAVSRFTESVVEKPQLIAEEVALEKTSSFSNFQELLPTIGEEDEEQDCTPSHNENLKQDKNNSTTRKTNQGSKSDSVESERESERDAMTSSNTDNQRDVASRATQIVQIISEENMCLRKQLEKCCQEISRLQNIEKEYRNVQMMYKDLKGAFINREHKEKAMRLRLEAEISQLQNTNKELRDQIQEAKNILPQRSPENVATFSDIVNKRDEEIRELQKEKAACKVSLQNLERLLKRKSSEIIILQKQLESQPKQEKRNVKAEDPKKLHDLAQIWQQTYTHGEKFHEKMLNKTKLRSRSQGSDQNVSLCVPVLVDLLKEKDDEITRLRKKMNQKTHSEDDEEDNWKMDGKESEERNTGVLNTNNETYSNDDKRYSELENAIKSLHVEMAERDATIKILECKYGLNECSSKGSATPPLRIPSFTTSQLSSVSSYEDSGIATECNTNNKEEKLENWSEESQNQKDDELNDHCWFV